MSVKIIYHGHSNVEIHSASHRIQIDPFYTGNPLADIPAAQANPTPILLSHAHGDHVGDSLAIAQRTQASIYANFEMCLHLQKLGDGERVADVVAVGVGEEDVGGVGLGGGD